MLTLLSQRTMQSVAHPAADENKNSYLAADAMQRCLGLIRP